MLYSQYEVEGTINDLIFGASEDEMTIAASATKVEVTPPTLSTSQNEMTIAASATKVEATPPTLSASHNEMTIATSATEVEVTPQLRVLHRMK
ncbi:hypothetical protein [Okeania sp. KiyG1]|uniref:hypothetical protein n=1 Tax=Okeania sp. KiyG1 TaxID=2720165 RepID=UPI001924D79A|nr:hypothetical protein [Okeania sp. KiyG1]GGA54248.1 hypothetical protein CYANOKiyG1_74510 [Okeania sp. KiyG1]